MVRLKGDYPPDIVTLWKWKGDTHSSICWTSNNTGDVSVSQMGKLCSEVLIHLNKCSQSISNTGEAINLLDITFRNHCFFGPLSFHSLDPCMFKKTCYMDLYLLRLHAPCVFENTYCMGFTFHISHLYFKANFIRLAWHSCMFRNTSFHEWAFLKIFISFPYTLYWWQSYLFQV